jgi:uncharacterized protein YjbI with pentapeptide repeats
MPHKLSAYFQQWKARTRFYLNYQNPFRKLRANLVRVLTFFLIVAIGTVLYLHFKGYQWPNSMGFGEQPVTKSTKEGKSSDGMVSTVETVTVPRKTLWDLMALLIVPGVLAVIALQFNRRQKESELQAAKSKHQEDALRAYFTSMTELLLTHKLGEPKASEKVRTLAEAHTLTVLQELDGNRKGSLMRFLIDARLVHDRKGETPGDFRNSRPVVRLKGADLRDANLKEANLSHVDLTGADLRGADLRQARLTKTVTDQRTQLNQRWQLVLDIQNRRLSLQKDALRGKDLSEADLSYVDFREFDLRNTNLTGANLEFAKLEDVRIDFSTLIDRKWRTVFEIMNGKARIRELKNTDLRSVYLGAAPLNRAQLQNSNLMWANMEYAQLNEANLSGATLAFANMTNANLRKAVLKKVRGLAVHLNKAELNEANLTEANLFGAKLRGAILEGADLTHATLTSADLRGAKLSGATLTNAELKESTYDCKTEWPNGFDAQKYGAKEAEAVVEGT